MIEKHDSVDVFLGVDVGKSAHHAVALARDGSMLLDRALPNDEARLQKIIGELKQAGT
jgi:activator of 2-hydroxyglutaryl-CoA dehydratase